MIHHAYGAVDEEIPRPGVGGLAIEAVVEELAAKVYGETQVVAEVILEDDTETDAGDDIEWVGAGALFRRKCVGIFRVRFQYDARIREIVGDGSAQTHIELRVVGGVVFSQRMPVDDIVDEELVAVEAIGVIAVRSG